MKATTSTPVTIEVNGVTLGGSPFALRPTNGANYIVTVELNLAAGDQHIVASQKAADGTISQQSTDVRSSGTTGSSSFTPNPIQTILNGFQTGSTGGHTVTFGMNQAMDSRSNHSVMARPANLGRRGTEAVERTA